MDSPASLPWPGGSSALPPFASHANRALAEEIDTKQAELDRLLGLVEDQTARERRMAAYAARVRAENGEARKLIEVRRREVDEEMERTGEAAAESSRLERELADLARGISKADAQVKELQDKIAVRRRQSDALGQAAEATKDELGEALDIQRLRDEQEAAYREKQKQIPKEMECKFRDIQDIDSEVAELENRCFEEESTAQSLRNTLAVLVSRLSHLRAHKASLVEQWQSQVSALSTVDSLIHSTEAWLEDARAEVHGRMVEVKRAEQRLQRDAQVLEKVEMPALSRKERELRDARNKLATVLRLVGSQKSELQTLSSAMERSGKDLSSVRELNSRKRRGLNELEHHVIPTLEDKIAAIEADIQCSETKRAEEAKVVEGLEALVSSEEARLAELEGDLASAKEQHRDFLQEADRLRQDEKRILSEVAAGETAIQKVDKQISSILKDIETQEALMYGHELASLELRRSMRQLRGLDLLDADLEILSARIKELGLTLNDDTGRLKKLRDECVTIAGQVSKQEGRLSGVKAELESSTCKSKELDLECSALSRELAQKARERETLLVELAMTKLHLRRLEERKALGEADLGSFAERMAQAQAAFEEKREELEAELSRLRSAVAKAEEAKSETQRLVATERLNMDKLKRRWELLTTKLEGFRERAGTSDGYKWEGATDEDMAAESERIQRSLAEDVARQKQELLDAQANLREQTAEVEAQIAKLRITLAETRAANVVWKKQMEMRGVSEKTVEVRNGLEKQLQDTVAFMNSRRAKLRELEDELREIQVSVTDWELKREEIQRDRLVEETNVAKLEREASDGLEKLARAKAAASRAMGSSTTARVRLGIRILREAKKDLGERMLHALSLSDDTPFDPASTSRWLNVLREAGIGQPESRRSTVAPRSQGFSKGSVARSRASGSAAQAPRPASPSVVRFPSNPDQLVKSRSQDRIRTPPRRPSTTSTVPALRNSRAATPSGAALSVVPAQTKILGSTDSMTLAGRSIPGSRGSKAEM
ncbi:hypothetical protein DFJ74DRAFT_759789 [Hyaloraphidium curvatum]|nr:hypothetical protein DFJ74DRAFT_759789 [Hyaloraphidium curvatum]